MSITSNGTPFTQNFDVMGTSGTATLPTGFKIGTDWSTGTTATTQAAGTSGTGILNGSSAGGAYNFANGVTATSSDRSLGFLNSSGYTSPRSIVLCITNNTGTTITSLNITFDYEKYRSGSRQFDWTFFHGSTTSPSTSSTSGDQSYPADANNTTINNPPTTTSKSVSLTGLSIADGTNYYLKWTFTGLGGSTNGQGIGIDNFSITSTGTVTCPSISTQPSNSSIVWGNGTNFTITSSNTTGYQWEINSGGGWSSLSNNSTYSGVTSPTLTISNSTLSMNGYKYRCVLSASSCSNVTSDSCILTVNNRANIGNGIIINEASQGESGSKEYIEMLVVGTPCSTMDIRGWVIDDNNGSFSNGHQNQTGVAPGHIKFSNNSLWSNISIGTIILIYNGADTSSSIYTNNLTYFDNDPTDYKLLFSIINTDSTYFIGNSTSPNSSSSSYSSLRVMPDWSQISLRNSYDAVQIRDNNYNYYHGISFSDSSATSAPDSGIWVNRGNHPDFVIYGTNVVFFTKSEIGPSPYGSARNYYITDTTFGYDVKDRINWNTDTLSGTRTPGSANNSKNSAWLTYLRSCPLPIEINEFKTICENGLTKIYFSTLSQTNVNYFFLEKSLDGREWFPYQIFKGEMFSNQLKSYQFTDNDEKSYYRIKEVDYDGKITYSKIIYASCNASVKDISIVNRDNYLTISSDNIVNITLYSIDGRLISSHYGVRNHLSYLGNLPKGIYVLRVFNDDFSYSHTEKILVK